MNKKYIMTIDFGTQSVRVGIFDSVGNIIDMESERYVPSYFSTRPGYAEQDPDAYYKYLAKASKRLWEHNEEYKKKIVGVSMTSFRDSIVMCDEDMKPVRPAILWLDQRHAELKEKLPFMSRKIFSLVGLTHTVKFNRERTPALWMKENEPAIWAKVKKYMTISTYITYKIIGEYKDCIANYAGHFPTDFKHRRFYKSDKNLQGSIFGIKVNKLPKIVKAGEVTGKISKQCSIDTGIPAGLNFYSVGSDKSCETLGLGAMKKGIAAISCGTAASIEITSKKMCHPARFMPSYPSVIDDYFNCEVQVYRGFWMLRWFVKEFAEEEKKEAEIKNVAIEEILNKRLKDVPAGSNGLLLEPYWDPGLLKPVSYGSIIGFSAKHTKEHLYRAIIEGINYELKEGLINMEKSAKVKTKEIRISGGGSQSDEICQIISDIFNLPASRAQTYETTSLGAAVAGFMAAKVFDNVEEAMSQMIHVSKTFTPNPMNAKKYDYLFTRCYLRIYPALRKVFHKIKRFDEIKFKE